MRRSSRSPTKRPFALLRPISLLLRKYPAMAMSPRAVSARTSRAASSCPIGYRRGPGHRLRACRTRALLVEPARPHRFTAVQASARTGLLHCRLEGDRVILGGHCRTVIVGHFQL